MIAFLIFESALSKINLRIKETSFIFVNQSKVLHLLNQIGEAYLFFRRRFLCIIVPIGIAIYERPC